MSAQEGVSRRGLIAGASVGVAAAGGLAAAFAASHPSDAPTGAAAHPFFGDVQAGIVTAAQDRMHFAALTTDPRLDRAGLIGLLTDWTNAAARLTQGLSAGPIGPVNGSYDAPPDDTGEAIGLPPAALTLTFGFGPTLFDDRFGLAGSRPAALERLPHFPGDTLDEAQSDGDLCIQACADDPQVAVHAIRNLTRIAQGRAYVKWAQLGFGRTSSTTAAQDTPRNLFGFKDGTDNVRAEQTDVLDAHIWVQPGADPKAEWLAGGTYLVARKIAMTIETWDRSTLREQERVVGRSKNEGAPLSGGTEFTAPDFSLTGRGGRPLIDAASHVALAHPDTNGGVHMLRRGYNYIDGATNLGRLAAGLFFIAFVTDPRTHYIPMQTAMARKDAMAEYLRHVGSGLYAVPRGVRPGGYVGEDLFA